MGVEQVLRHNPSKVDWKIYRPDEGAVGIQDLPPGEDDVAFVLKLVDGEYRRATSR